MSLTRRQLLKTGALVAVATAVPVACATEDTPAPVTATGSSTAQPMSQQDFVELSSMLTGMPPAGLDRAGATALAGLFAAQAGECLALKAALDAQGGAPEAMSIPPEHAELARSVARAWYVGMVDDQIGLWTGTLAYTAADATAPGTCGGFGEWAVAPGAMTHEAGT